MSSRARSLAGLAVIALVVGSCGGGATASPSTEGSSAPGASSAPAASDVPASAAPTSAGQGPDLSGAAAALADLDSYHLKTVMTMQGMEDSLFAAFGDGLQLEGTIIFKPEQAADLTISMGTAAQKLAMGYRLLGDKAWISLGSDTWTETTAEDAKTTIEGFAPAKMLGSFSGMTGLTAVGEESKNGVDTVHYQASGSAIGDAVGNSIGLPGADWTVDLWVAKDAGYAVGYAIVGKSDAGSFGMTLDVSDINSPSNTVVAPPASE